ncbi:hypothetical protein C0995_004422 [Termitomyces sp. Mi166|nr:hypothetical protein C0995_004422 [Termitomyces sp. Mi166\
MTDYRYWLFPNDTIVFVFTPWEELPFHSIKIIQIQSRNFKSLEGLVINTKTAWDKIQIRDPIGMPSSPAYCKVEEFKLQEREKGGELSSWRKIREA